MVFPAFAVVNGDGALAEIEVFDAQARAIHKLGGEFPGAIVCQSICMAFCTEPYAGWGGTRELTTPGDPIRLLHVFPSNSLAA
jgi:hypothetical protein